MRLCPGSPQAHSESHIGTVATKSPSGFKIRQNSWNWAKKNFQSPCCPQCSKTSYPCTSSNESSSNGYGNTSRSCTTSGLHPGSMSSVVRLSQSGVVQEPVTFLAQELPQPSKSSRFTRRHSCWLGPSRPLRQLSD